MINNIAISNWYTKGQSLSKQPHRTASISLPMPTSFQTQFRLPIFQKFRIQMYHPYRVSYPRWYHVQSSKLNLKMLKLKMTQITLPCYIWPSNVLKCNFNINIANLSLCFIKQKREFVIVTYFCYNLLIKHLGIYVSYFYSENMLTLFYEKSLRHSTFKWKTNLLLFYIFVITF